MSGEFLGTGETVIFAASIPIAEEEKKLVAHFTLPRGVPKRINEFLSARYCALRSFESLGVGLQDLPAVEKDAPLWPAGFIGSLSHCDKMAVCVARKIGAGDILGIDVEEIMTPERSQTIGNSIASLEEQSLWTNSNKCLEMTRLFSAKEAFYKAIHPHCRCFIDFLEVQYKSLNTHEWQLTLASQKSELKALNGTYMGKTLYKNNFIISLLQTSKRETSIVPL
ncbi:MAG: 4'-phosphopantetheinyl transferase superfamily protein [Bacteriovoracaceae bacterium]|nr:4'-phosphopantetheinyl transferase superfamily protein [Bacteriovoracaceae bacterium]